MAESSGGVVAMDTYESSLNVTHSQTNDHAQSEIKQARVVGEDKPRSTLQILVSQAQNIDSDMSDNDAHNDDTSVNSSSCNQHDRGIKRIKTSQCSVSKVFTDSDSDDSEHEGSEEYSHKHKPVNWYEAPESAPPIPRPTTVLIKSPDISHVRLVPVL